MITIGHPRRYWPMHIYKINESFFNVVTLSSGDLYLSHYHFVGI